jgi:ribosomal-protein-alanine N-acetyltransferase
VSLLRIETARLILRPWVPSDAAAGARFYRDPEVIRFMAATEVSEEEVAEAIRGHIVRYYERRGLGALAGVLKGTERIVGRYGLQYVELDGVEELEVSYLTSAEFRRQGLASEAVRALVAAAWREGRRRIVALIQPDNVASQRLAEGVGFRFERDVVREGLAMKLYAAEQRGPTGPERPGRRGPEAAG